MSRRKAQPVSSLDPFLVFRYLAIILGFWLKRVGPKAVLGMLGAGTILAVILNYTT